MSEMNIHGMHEDEVIKKLDELKTEVTSIKTALIGNEQLKLEGLAQKVDRHDKHLSKIDKRNWMVMGGLALLTAVGWLWSHISNLIIK
jgi:predicted  nucleic acid-binding Zn-ribbon protein